MSIDANKYLRNLRNLRISLLATELFRAVFYADAYAADASGQRFLTARPAASADIVPLEIITNPLR